MGAVAALMMVLNFTVAEMASASHDVVNFVGAGETHGYSGSSNEGVMAEPGADHGDSHSGHDSDGSHHDHRNHCGSTSCNLFLTGFDGTTLDRSVDSIVAAVATNPWAAAPQGTPYKPPRLAL